jgi:hypothetical protein
MKKSLIALAALSACGDMAFGSTRKSRDEEFDAGNGCFANVDSSTLNANTYMQAFGNAVVASGSIALTANPTAADVLRIMRIPAGTRVDALMVASDDLDTGTPTIVVGIGYAPCDGSSPAASAAYFAAAGQTFAQAGTSGTLYCKFAPVTFDKDVWLTMTVGTASATFAAGSIYVTALGVARGTK